MPIAMPGRRVSPWRLAPLAPLALAGCVGWGDDPFGTSDRPVVGAVRLHAAEDGSVWLRTPADTGGGLTGQVVRAGWDGRRVAVLLAPNGRRAGGWYVYDAAGAALAGPLPAAPGGLRTLSADSAYSRLGGRAPGV